MRILVCDYSGHPFQVQLSRELARRGHQVQHVYSAGFQTPKGNLEVREGDPPGFEIVPARNSKPFAKHTFLRRRNQEIEIGKAFSDLVERFRPDVVISSNSPIDTLRILHRGTVRTGAKFILWLQDIHSEAVTTVVPRKFPVIGHAVAAWYRHMEFAVLRASDHVVAITEDFLPILRARGVDGDRITAIENWAPLDELPQYPRDNDWAAANMPGDAMRIVYSGTLGYKHNPGILLLLARELPEAHVHVFSEGEAADGLAKQAREERIANLTVHPWVPFSDLPRMLSGADLFIAVIEKEAGVYSVPSKILTYLAIGRPILASIPPENLAARLIANNQAGFVATPGDENSLVEQARLQLTDAPLRERLGRNGREYARKAFDIETLGDRFLQIIANLA